MAIFITNEDSVEMNNLERGVKTVQALEYKGRLFRNQTEVEEYIQTELASKVQEYIFHEEECDSPCIAIAELFLLMDKYDTHSVIEALKEYR